MPAVVFGTGLEEEAFRLNRGELEGFEAILKELAYACQFLAVNGHWRFEPFTLHNASAFDHSPPSFGAGWMYAKKKT